MANKKLWLVLLLGLILRLLAITVRPLWYDEAFAVLFSEKGLAAMLQGTLETDAAGSAADVHPLTYYTLLCGWMRAFGQSAWSLRGLSVLIGTGTLAIIYNICKELLGEKTALWGTLLVAISPFHIHYSQEIRMYALLTLLLVAATYALWKGMRSRQWGWWVLFSIFTSLAQYTHNLAFVFLIPLASTPLLWKDWRSLGKTALASFAAVLLYVPWLFQVPKQFSKLQEGYWIKPPGIDRVLTTLLTYVTNLPLSNMLLPVALFIAILLIVFGAVQTIRNRKQHIATAKEGGWLAYMAFTPMLLLLAISQWQPVYIERALLPAGVMFSLWVAWYLVHNQIHQVVRSILFGLAFIAAVIGIFQHITYRGFPYAPYQALGDHLQAQTSPGDAIVHSNKLSFLPMVYYFRTMPQTYVADPPGSGSDTLALPTQKTLGLLAKPDTEEAVGDADTVYLIIFEKAIDEYRELGETTHPDLAWLDDHFVLSSETRFDELLLYRYEQ